MKVVCPTRGIIFAETIESLRKNGIDLNELIIVNGRPIPDAQNEGVSKALESSPSHILFIEEDMAIPEGTVDAMLKLDKPVVAVDYPVDNGHSTITHKGEEIIWCGLGCTLINAGVFKNLPKPWFDISYSQRIVNEDPLELERIENPYKYGGHDINFFINVRKAGYEIHQLPGIEAKHLRCSSLQKGNMNNGEFKITSLELTKRQQYN